VNQAHTKFSQGYSATGVGAMDCARYGFKRQMESSTSRRVNGNFFYFIHLAPTSSLRPSRYTNMDFALLSTLLPSLNDGISHVLVLYDIGCQWVKNLQSRVSQYSISASLNLSSLFYWRVVVPKFHLSGHGESCQIIYNLNYTRGRAVQMVSALKAGGLCQATWQCGHVKMAPTHVEPSLMTTGGV